MSCRPVSTTVKEPSFSTLTGAPSLSWYSLIPGSHLDAGEANGLCSVKCVNSQTVYVLPSLSIASIEAVCSTFLFIGVPLSNLLHLTMDSAVESIRSLATTHGFSPPDVVRIFEAGILAAHALRPDLVPGVEEKDIPVMPNVGIEPPRSGRLK